MFSFIKKHFDLIGYIALTIFFVVLNYNLYINMDLLIDSDMASEMLYSKLLVENKSLFLNNWYYSTAIETLDIPLVFAPLFLLTNNWHTVRIVGIIILDILLYLSFYYVCKQLDIKHIPWLAFLILGSVSNEYFDFVLKGSYYIPYIMVTFIATGLLLDISKNKNNIKLTLLIILSILAGLNGLRQLVQCFACLFGSSLLLIIFRQFEKIKEKTINKKEETYILLKYSFISLFFSSIGYLINMFLLSSLYSFKSDWDLKIEIASISRIKDIIYGWATMFGYETGYIWTIIISILFIIILCISIIYLLKKYNKDNKVVFIILLFFISTITTFCIFIFTNMNLQIRYFIQVFVNSILIIGLLIDKLSFNKQTLLICIILCMSIICTSFQFNKDVNNSTNSDLILIKDILIENDSLEGYGSFWNANVMTELSDGKIEVWNFHNYEEDDGVDINNLDKWLQKKEHFERKPNGKVFLILTYMQKDKVDINEKIDKYCCFEGKNRILYIFNNINEFNSIFK